MENVSGIKTTNCLRMMYVKEIIFEHTDETHFITASEIIDMLKNGYGITTTRKTLYSDIDTLIESGFDIECVRGRQNKYHVLSREFELAELRLLIDTIQSMKSISNAKTNSLINKISRLAGPSADILLECTISGSCIKTDNNQVYYIIDKICDAIAKNKQIAFRYYECLSDNKKNLLNYGEEYHVSPYQLVCNTNYYYLIGYSSKHEKITTFRVDRISGIPSIINRQSIPAPQDLNTKKHSWDTIHLKGEEESEITLSFEKSVMNAMVDRFGQNMNITSIGQESCVAKVFVPINNIFFAWIFGFEGKVKILAPNNIKDRYILMVAKEMARL